MDSLFIFVNEFINQIANMDKGIRQMRSFYVFQDDRIGTVEERFRQDAKSWAEFEKLRRER